MREITCLNLAVTTHCSMKCPDCCCGIPQRPVAARAFYDWPYFAKAAEIFQGIEQVHLTGGEPTLHPAFVEFSARFRAAFGCRLLTLESNGWGFRRFPEAFKVFDRVQVSRYTTASFVGCADNGAEIEFLRSYLEGTKTQVVDAVVVFTPRTRRLAGDDLMCHRGRTGIVAYSDGKLFPCCVGPGLAEEVAITPERDWRAVLPTVRPPCVSCFFAGT